jgi:flagellar biogenesis protein FliO
MGPSSSYLVGAVVSFVAALALIVYGCWFWRKMKRLRLI